LALSLCGGLKSVQADPTQVANGHALLVGCTKYPHLLPSRQLVGPGNDVVLMRRLLVERFAFPPSHIVTLAEGVGGEGMRPTRANIRREFDRLAQQAKPGDQVVILLAGHGSQQPQPDPPDPGDVEPDGMDELFLPCDFRPWDGTPGTPRNAIQDNELKLWLKAICDTGAFVWIIVDACHAGTTVRGSRGDVLRRAPPEEILSPSMREQAQRRASGTAPGARRLPSRFTPTDLREDAGHLVALYASQADEATLETLLPPGSSDQQRFGLFTYSLNLILNRASSPLTYRELVQRVYRQYVQWGRIRPTPGVDGLGQDREVLGLQEWPGRSRYILERKASGQWTISGGALHGLTSGTILAVYPPMGEKGSDVPAGHVQIGELRTLEAQVIPCAFGDGPVRGELLAGGRCEPVYVDYGLRRMRVSVHDEQGGMSSQSRSALRDVRAALAELARRPGALVELIDRPMEADWQVYSDAGRLYLVPGQGWISEDDPDNKNRMRVAAPSLFGPIPLGEGTARWLDDRLHQISRAQNLLRLAAFEQGTLSRGTAVRVAVQPRRFRDHMDQEGTPIRWGPDGITLYDGDIVGFRIENRSSSPVDVTLLFVDSGFGITPVFPSSGTTGDNRLPPGSALVIARGLIDSCTTGREHMVVIAVKGKGPFIDFGCFAQPTLPQARSGSDRQHPAMATPLGLLLQSALFAQGSTRGCSSRAVQDYSLQLISWRTSRKSSRRP